MAERDRDRWLHDFGFVLLPSVIHRQSRHDPDYKVFLGSKLPVFAWLALVAGLGGAIGGVLVSGALWTRWWAVPLVVASLAGLVVTAHRFTRHKFGQPITFLAGWCLFFAVLTGAFAMWGAQLTSTAWAYGIAGVAVFFLLGITGGLIEPPNSKPMEHWFLTSALTAPASSCLAVWIFRNLLPDSPTLTGAALTGLLAALPFLSVTMALHLLAWRPERAVLRLATLYLHNDDFVEEAERLLDRAIRDLPPDPILFERRALARALAGKRDAAVTDWEQAQQLDPQSHAPALGRGWVALRRGNFDVAVQNFEQSMPKGRRCALPLQGAGVARLRMGDAAGALQLLRRIPKRDLDALSLTYLAEAWLDYGDTANAIGAATDAIEEADSTHGRTWLVRAEAYRVNGRIESAAEDYNRAIWAADEPGIEQRALAGLNAIDRPVSEDEPEW